MGRPAPMPWEDREDCPMCGQKIAYLPLGRYCLFDGYLWIQKLKAAKRRLVRAPRIFRAHRRAGVTRWAALRWAWLNVWGSVAP